MAKPKNKKLSDKLHHKYRLIIYNDNTFEEVWFMRLSRLNVFTLGGTSILAFIAIVTLLIAFTPIREFIPGYPDSEMRRNLVRNAQRLDSLEHEIDVRDKYFQTINSIVRGETPESFEESQDTNVTYEEVHFERSKHDSLLRQQIEEAEIFNLSLSGNGENPDFTRLHFYAPVQGIITRSFNPEKGHYGTDIVAEGNKVVVAVLDGTVTMANWTLETGYVIQIQHANNLISVYKHNAELLKKVGNHVSAGESIAIIGNSGEVTSGPHLHFELWHNGSALNPEDYIYF
jgi:murein DD-endopeptidase MepM/ murein hydrolase activator NlpD